MRASSGACRVDPRLVSQAWHPAPPCSNRASLSTRTRLDYAAHTLSSLVTATPGRADSACRALHPAATLPVTKTRPAGPPGLPPSSERVMRAGSAVHGAGPGPGCSGRSISQGHAVSRRMCLEPGARLLLVRPASCVRVLHAPPPPCHDRPSRCSKADSAANMACPASPHHHVRLAPPSAAAPRARVAAPPVARAHRPGPATDPSRARITAAARRIRLQLGATCALPRGGLKSTQYLPPPGARPGGSTRQPTSEGGAGGGGAGGGGAGQGPARGRGRRMAGAA